MYPKSESVARLQSFVEWAQFVRLSRFCAVVLASLAAFLVLARPGSFAAGNASSFRCLELSVSLAAVLVLLAAGTAWIRAAAWFAISMIGGAAALQLIVAGRPIRFQHYSFSVSDVHALCFAIIGVQLAATGVGLWRMRRKFPANLRRAGILPLSLAAAVVILSSAAASKNPLTFGSEVIFSFLVQCLGAASMVLLSLALPASVDRLRVWRLFEPEALPTSPRLDRYAVWIAAWTLVVTGTLSWFVYQAHPHVPDEVAYYIQAHYFANAQLELPAPPAKRAFDVDLMSAEASRWYSAFPPGWPAFLAVGFVFGVPWLINPVLAAFCVCGIYLLTWHLYDRGTARLALLLASCSPWFLFMGMNFMAHTATLACALIAALAIIRAKQRNQARWMCLAGLGVGVAAIIRPFDGFILAVIMGFCALAAIPGRRQKALCAGLFVLFTAASASVSLPYNSRFTGHPLKFPTVDYFDKVYGPGTNSLGFGPSRGINWPLHAFPGHGIRNIIVNTQLDMFLLNTELLGWCTGSMLIVLWFWFRPEKRSSDYLLLFAAICFPLCYSFYWYSGGPDFGARYWYVAIVPLLVFAARGIRNLMGCFEQNARVLAVVTALSVLSVGNVLPWRAVDKYYGYLNMRPDVRSMASQLHFGKSLVFIRGERHPDYASAAVYNPLDLRTAAPVYVWDRDPQARAEALQAFPNRAVWVLNGPTITGRGYEVVSSPRAK